MACGSRSLAAIGQLQRQIQTPFNRRRHPQNHPLTLQTHPRWTATLHRLIYGTLLGQPVWIKEKKSQKIQERWYYIDIEKALDPFVEREEAIISLPASRIKSGFGINGSLDCSTPQKEYETLMFPWRKCSLRQLESRLLQVLALRGCQTRTD
jgi:hypothetical protein